MLEAITIENYKSIEKLSLSLGRTNVFIGENGAGKSNILEAIALAGAAAANKLDNEFLSSRGIRVTGPLVMRSAFKAKTASAPIKLSAQILDGAEIVYELQNDNKPYSSWQKSVKNHPRRNLEPMVTWLRELLAALPNDDERKKLIENLRSAADLTPKKRELVTLKFSVPEGVAPPKFDTAGLEDFIIYSPENSALRTFEREGQIQPLGISGEGLMKLLRVTSRARNKTTIRQIKESLKLFGWFKDLKIVKGTSDDRMMIVDRFVHALTDFDQRSANEGFLFLAFYVTLFTSKLTPRFFAVDNVDTSLNPKLCEMLMRRLTKLAKEHDKQVIFTTHNPAILDGLDLNDPEHRLFVISRGQRGETRVRRFEKKPSSDKPRRLSDLFVSGALGGLPKGF
ncbi:ATP-binding protein [Bradyrhizobium sp. DOA1]|uniref:AAA family ATPase n=1 Tax=Bradyrhizobium sp. DOA1 TaxID=1126616 RepID=UPI00077C9A56|nr:ATP-binding protein [Bradyrhizobium sp. DOA1]KYG98032.1 hypothetical protein SE91_05335 [Bradyrhizobium sp. DOA1]